MNLMTQRNRRFEDVRESEFLAHFSSPASLARGDYETILQNWTAAFGPNSLWIGMYEDLESRPRDLLSDVFAHLGLSTTVDWPDFPYRQKVFAGAAVAMPPQFAEFLGNLYRPRVARLGDRFGIDVSRWRF